MRSKLVGVFGIVLCLTALPWTAQSKAVTTKSPHETGGRALSAWPGARDNARDATLGTGIDVAAAGISPGILQLALTAVTCATAHNEIKAPPTLTVIDYSRPSTEPRLWVFDLRSKRLLFKELVAHGRNSGGNMATRFSDAMNSLQSSIGLFITADAYLGNNGYSLRLDGLEPGFNGRARERAIVMHGAPYVNAGLAKTQGRIGRSWGCPALREGIIRRVIDTIRGGSVIFSYYPDAQWLRRSRFLNGCSESRHPTRLALNSPRRSTAG